MKPKYPRSIFLPAALISALVACQSASAANLSWDSDTSTAGVQSLGGTWNTTNTNWWNGSGNVSWNNSTPDTATFDSLVALAANRDITVNEPITAGGITFDQRGGTSSFVLIGTSSLSLAENAVINVISGTTRLDTPVASPFVKTGSGRLVINNNNTALTGIIAVNGNRLQIGNNSSTGGLGSASVVLGDSTAQVVIRRVGSVTFTNEISGNGAVVFQLNTSSSVTVKPTAAWSYSGTTGFEPSGSNIAGGKVILGASNVLPLSNLYFFKNGTSLVTLDLKGFSQKVNSISNQTGTTVASAVITNSSSTLSTFTLSNPELPVRTYDGLISGKIALIKENAGTVILTQSSTYTGSTTVVGGILSLKQKSLEDTAAVVLGGTGKLNLDFVGQDSIGALYVEGVKLASGTYNSTTHPGFITGGGELLVLPSPVYNDLIWDSAPETAGIQAGNGIWDTTLPNWSDGVINTVWNSISPDRATFDAGAPLTSNILINLTTNVTSGNLTFLPRQSSLTFAITGSSKLTLQGTPEVKVIDGTSRIDSLLDGGFTKTGNGRLVIGGDSPDFTGTVTIASDRLQFGNGGPAGSLGVAAIVNNSSFVIRCGGVSTLVNPVSGLGQMLIQAGFDCNLTINPSTTLAYTGNTTIEPTGANIAGGKVVLGASDRLPTATRLSMTQNGVDSAVTFDLRGFNQTVGSLVSVPNLGPTNMVITNSSLTPSTFTVSGTQEGIYGGQLSGNLSLVKTGISTLTLTAPGSYTGATTVNGGVLSIPAPSLADASGVVISTGVLDLAFAGEDTVASLTINGTILPEGSYGSSHPTYGTFFSGDGTLKVQTPIATSNYASWANDPTKGNIPGQPGTGDFDNDGLTNLMEYALGKNPGSASQPAGVLSGNTIIYTKGADAIANGDVSWIIETSPTLATGSWTPQVTQAARDAALTIEYTFTPASPASNFARLKVSQP